jgi:sensor histidine kinase YesM
MKNKMVGGKINVSFNLHEEGINASVTDNGPGISAEKRSMDSSGHKSIGMTLTKKRLEILSNNEVFKVSTVLDNEGVVTGTKVSMVIPIS